MNKLSLLSKELEQVKFKFVEKLKEKVLFCHQTLSSESAKEMATLSKEWKLHLTMLKSAERHLQEYLHELRISDLYFESCKTICVRIRGRVEDLCAFLSCRKEYELLGKKKQEMLDLVEIHLSEHLPQLRKELCQVFDDNCVRICQSILNEISEKIGEECVEDTLTFSEIENLLQSFQVLRVCSLTTIQRTESDFLRVKSELRKLSIKLVKQAELQESKPMDAFSINVALHNLSKFLTLDEHLGDKISRRVFDSTVSKITKLSKKLASKCPDYWRQERFDKLSKNIQVLESLAEECSEYDDTAEKCLEEIFEWLEVQIKNLSNLPEIATSREMLKEQIEERRNYATLAHNNLHLLESLPSDIKMSRLRSCIGDVRTEILGKFKKLLESVEQEVHSLLKAKGEGKFSDLRRRLEEVRDYEVDFKEAHIKKLCSRCYNDCVARLCMHIRKLEEEFEDAQYKHNFAKLESSKKLLVEAMDTQFFLPEYALKIIEEVKEKFRSLRNTWQQNLSSKLAEEDFIFVSQLLNNNKDSAEELSHITKSTLHQCRSLGSEIKNRISRLKLQGGCEERLILCQKLDTLESAVENLSMMPSEKKADSIFAECKNRLQQKMDNLLILLKGKVAKQEEMEAKESIFNYRELLSDFSHFLLSEFRDRMLKGLLCLDIKK